MNSNWNVEEPDVEAEPERVAKIFEKPSVFGVRLWHDDIRPAPDGWTWARTNEEALRILRTYEVAEASLDHDLGLHITSEKALDEASDPWTIYKHADLSPTGVELAKAMVEERLVPPRIRIHSWNYQGARRMAAILAGHSAVEIRAFRTGENT